MKICGFYHGYFFNTEDMKGEEACEKPMSFSPESNDLYRGMLTNNTKRTLSTLVFLVKPAKDGVFRR